MKHVGFIAGLIALCATELFSQSSDLDLYLLIGQSNMAGRGELTPTNRINSDRIFKLNAKGEWQRAQEPIHYDKTIAGAGLAASFARTMADKDKNVKIGLIPCAVGGTGIDRWVEGGDLWSNSVARTRKALKSGKLKGILWHQGEGDANPTLAPSWGVKFASMIASLRREFGDVPFVAGELGEYLESNKHLWQDINRHLHALEGKLVNYRVVSAKGLTPKQDKLHFDTQSLRVFGRRYAQALLSCSTAAPIDPMVPFAYQDIGVEQTCRELKKIKSASGLKRFLLTAPRFNAVMYGPFAPDLHEKIGRDIAEVKNSLAGSGIEVGWWCAPSIRYFSNFPSIEDWQGNTSKDNKKCPLDEAFIADFAAKIKTVAAAARPRVINIEDDFTLAWGRGLNGLGACFCKRHVDAFAKRYGKSLSAAEIADAFMNRTPANLPIRKAFADTVRDSLANLAKRVRAAVDEVDPTIRIMLCESGSCSDKDGDCLEAVVRAFAGGTRPMLRPSGAIYGAETTPADVPGAVSHTFYTLERLPKDIETFYEADPYPHNRFYTSAAQLGSLMAGAVMAGVDNFLLYCLQYLDDPFEDSGYADRFVELKPRFQAARNFIAANNARLAGVRIVWQTEQLSLTRGYGDDLNGQLEWGAYMMSKFGLPYTMRQQYSGPSLMMGKVDETITDDEILRILKDGVLLDAVAAHQLQVRGFGKYIGADVKLAENRLPIIKERIMPAAGLERAGKTVNAFYIFNAGTEGTVKRFAVLKPHTGTEVLSEFYGVGDKLITPSMTLFENSLGGKVAILSTSLLGNRSSGLYNFRKQEMIRKIFNRLGNRALPVTALDAPGIWTLASVAQDNSQMLVMVDNLSGDDRDKLRFAVSDEWAGANVSYINFNGEREPIGVAGSLWVPVKKFVQMQPEFYVFSK